MSIVLIVLIYKMPNFNGRTTSVEKADRIMEQFRSLGFAAIQKPGDVSPMMPADLGSMGMLELSNLMAHYTAWREYAEDLLSMATLQVSVLTEEYDRLYHMAFLSEDGKVTERKANAEAEPGVVAAQSKLSEADMYRELLLGKVESLTNCYTTLSREITLRSNTTDRIGRNR